MKIQTILSLIISFLAGAMVYAMDWQREQDRKISDLDKLIEKQKTILDMQIQINEKMEERRMFQPTYDSPKNDGRSSD